MNEEKDSIREVLGRYDITDKAFSFKSLHSDITHILNPNRRKEIGQYFTPEEVAKFMAQWVCKPSATIRILDPSIGCGILARYCLDTIQSIDDTIEFKLDGYDIDMVMIECAKNTLNDYMEHINLIHTDFLLDSNANKYDIIIANPPYVKNNKIRNRNEYRRELRSRYNITLEATASLYAYFIIKSIEMLSEDGRLAFIVPVEWLNAGYGEKLKEKLLDTLSIEALVIFEGDDFIFEDGMSSAVIILGKKPLDKKNKVKFIGLTKWYGISYLNNALQTCEIDKPNTIAVMKQSDLNPKDKWSVYINGYESDVYEGTIPLNQLFFVRRGIATGANSFFTLSDEEVNEWRIDSKYLQPIITKAAYATDRIFSQDHYEELKTQGKKVYLLNVRDESPNQKITNYLKFGEKQEIHKRYLTRKRKRWFFVEQRDVAPIWIKVFFRDRIRLILNQTDCRNLTSFHGIYPKKGSEAFLVPLILYSLSEIGEKIMASQIRHYGGGLKKLEPRDVESMMIPDFTLLTQAELELLESLFQNYIEGITHLKEINEQMDTVLKRISGRISKKIDKKYESTKLEEFLSNGSVE